MQTNSFFVRFSVLALLILGMVGGASAGTNTFEYATEEGDYDPYDDFYGVTYTPKNDIELIKTGIMSSSENTGADIRLTNLNTDTVIATTTADGDHADFNNIELKSGVDYSVTMNANSIRRSYSTTSNYNGENNDLTIQGYDAFSDVQGTLYFFDSVTYAKNTAPQFNSSSVTPDPPLLGENVSYSAEVFDSDGSVNELMLEVFNSTGHEIANETRSYSSSSVNDTFEDVFVPSSNQNYTAYFTVTDDAGASTVETIEREAIQPSNNPPQFNSTSISPDPPNVGESVSYDAEVFDSNGDPLNTCLNVSYGGTQEVNGFCLSGQSVSFNNVFTPQTGNKWLNATFEVFDNSTDSSNTTTELNRFLEDTVSGVSITEPENITYNSSSVPYDVTVSDDNDDVPNEQSYVTGYVDGTLKFNKTVTEGNNVSGTLTGLTESEHTFEVNATELNGGSSTTKSVNFTNSIDDPDVNIFNPESKTYDTGSVPLDVTASDPSSSISSYCYVLDGSNCIDFTPNTTLNPTEGEHDLEVFAFDEVGNNGSASVNFEIDQYKLSLKEPVKGFNYTSGIDNDADFNYNVSAFNKSAWLYYNNEVVSNYFIDSKNYQSFNDEVNIYEIGRQNWSVKIQNLTKFNETEETYVKNITQIVPPIDGKVIFDYDITYEERFTKNGWIGNDETNEVFDTDIAEYNYVDVSYSSSYGTIDGTDAIYFQNDGTQATTANYNLYGNQTSDNQIEFDLVIKDEITDQFNVRPQYRDSNGDLQRLAFIRFRDGDVEVADDPGDSFSTIATDYYSVGDYMNIEITVDYEDQRIFVDNGTQDLGTGYVDYSENVDKINGAGFSMFSNNVESLYNIVLMDNLEFDSVNQSYINTSYNINYEGDNITIESEDSYFNVRKYDSANQVTLFRPTATAASNGGRFGFSGDHDVNFLNKGNTSVQYKKQDAENWTSIKNYSFTDGQDHVAYDTFVVDEGDSKTVTINGEEHTFEVTKMNYTGDDLGIGYDYELNLDGILSDKGFYDVFFVDGQAVAGYVTDDNDSDIYDSVTFALVPQANLSRGNYQKRAVSWADNGAVYYSDVTNFSSVSNNDVDFVDATEFYVFEPERPDENRVFDIQSGTEFNINFEFIHELKNNVSGIRTFQILYDDEIIYNETLSSSVQDFSLNIDRDWDIGTYEWRVTTYTDQNGTKTSRSVTYSVGQQQGKFNLYVSFVKPVSEWVGLSPSMTRVVFTLLFVGIMYLAVRVAVTIGVNNEVGKLAGTIWAVIAYLLTVYIQLPTREFHVFVIFITIAYIAYKWWSN